VSSTISLGYNTFKQGSVKFGWFGWKFGVEHEIVLPTGNDATDKEILRLLVFGLLFKQQQGLLGKELYEEYLKGVVVNDNTIFRLQKRDIP